MKEIVSVLMCVYNTPVLFLREAIDSILNQTYADIEIIIVDDCSDIEEVSEYLQEASASDTRIRLIRNFVNSGLTYSLNIGLKECHGKYIARMDSDDISVGDRIERQANYLDKNPEVSLVGSNVRLFGDGITNTDEARKGSWQFNPEIHRIRSLMQHSGPPHPTFMFRTEFLLTHKIQYREDIIRAQDYGIMADILWAGGTIRILEDSLVKYRIHNGQITSNSFLEQKIYQCRVSNDYIGRVFPKLTPSERAAASLLGCNIFVKKVLDFIENSDKLHETGRFLIETKGELDNPRLYIRSIRKMIEYNRQYGLYDRNLFETEIRSEWWKKVVLNMKKTHSLWGMNVYTAFSFIYMIRAMRNK